MESFNLKEYLKNPSRKIVTKEGRNVRIKGYDAKGSYPVIGLVDYRVSEYPALFTEDGRCWGDPDILRDIFFAPEKHEGWINLCRTDTNTQIATLIPYDSKEKAIEASKGLDNYIKTIKIEWEE